MKERLENQVEQKSEYNLLTNYDETIKKMAEVEGDPAWLEQDKKSTSPDLTIWGAVIYLRNLHEEQSVEEVNESDHAVYTIYGVGGVSRWMVMADGEVRFSRSHDPVKAKKAEKLGFKLFE